jgi:hypothetical protein
VIPDNARTLRITAAAGTELAGASFEGTVTPGLLFEAGYSPPPTVVYNPKAVIPHAASLRQPCGHCARFPTAASRRSLGRISVPMWLAILSDQLPVVALVSRYLTNKLIGREPLLQRDLAAAFPSEPCDSDDVRGIIRPLGRLSPTAGQVAHVLRTRPPLNVELPPRPVRLACVRHAASVRPEPGSNSPKRIHQQLVPKRLGRPDHRFGVMLPSRRTSDRPPHQRDRTTHVSNRRLSNSDAPKITRLSASIEL